MIKSLPGTWHLILSNFPMWSKPGISNVNFNYALDNDNDDEKVRLHDDVKYLKDDKEKIISGYDYPKPNTKNQFKWQGKGLLFIAVSHWQVDWLHKESGIMIISFTKTLFTPEGVDILSRHQFPSEASLELAKKYIAGNAELNAKAKGLFRVMQKGLPAANN
jgi:hypothetical protein